ncbi:unnamed protein product [Heligmosomoides polygyrus]|uniref:PLAC domain-containing protein n=1 Tax=Heligmosomoides polygyrus TaxID=6339 RepID=A0A3P8BWE8_HELPZ|nr:unnamed protein product [Heligmosomoides polygyrus]
MKDGVLLEFSSVVQEHDRFRKVTIFPAAVSDSGEYRCAVGPNGLLSNGYMVKVVAPARESAPECTDSGTEKTCALIVRNGLCAKKRYSKFCCHSSMLPVVFAFIHGIVPTVSEITESMWSCGVTAELAKSSFNSFQGSCKSYMRWTWVEKEARISVQRDQMTNDI